MYHSSLPKSYSKYKGSRHFVRLFLESFRFREAALGCLGIGRHWPRRKADRCWQHRYMICLEVYAYLPVSCCLNCSPCPCPAAHNPGTWWHCCCRQCALHSCCELLVEAGSGLQRILRDMFVSRPSCR